MGTETEVAISPGDSAVQAGEILLAFQLNPKSLSPSEEGQERAWSGVLGMFGKILPGTLEVFLDMHTPPQ